MLTRLPLLTPHFYRPRLGYYVRTSGVRYAPHFHPNLVFCTSSVTDCMLTGFYHSSKRHMRLESIAVAQCVCKKCALRVKFMDHINLAYWKTGKPDVARSVWHLRIQLRIVALHPCSAHCLFWYSDCLQHVLPTLQSFRTFKTFRGPCSNAQSSATK